MGIEVPHREPSGRPKRDGGYNKASEPQTTLRAARLGVLPPRSGRALYVLTIGGLEFLKVGSARIISRRMEGVRHSNPFGRPVTVRLAAAFRGKARDMNRLEQRVHEVIASRSKSTIDREWHAISVQDALFAIRDASTELGIELVADQQWQGA